MVNVTKKIVLLIFAGVTLALVWYFFLPYVETFSDETLDKRIKTNIALDSTAPVPISIGDTKLYVDLVSTESDRRRGLGGIQYIEEDRGMLFVFEKSGNYSIWMKDMRFPIDVAWLDEKFKVVHIEQNISPRTYPKSFTSDAPAKYILEVNAGFFEKNNISVGSMVGIVDDENL